MYISKRTTNHWLIAAGAFLFMISSTFCNTDRIKGSGHQTTKDVAVENFNAVEISGYFDVELTQSNKEALRIEADDNLMKYIDVKVNQDKKLQIEIKDHIEFTHSKKLKLYLTYSNLHSIEVNGAAHLHSKTPARSQNMDIEISGAASVDMDFFTESLKINESGAGSFKLAGKTTKLEVNISGAGSIDAYALEAKNAKIEISGAGSANVLATNTLDVQISGVGSVKYKGNPSINKSITAIGTLKNDN